MIPRLGSLSDKLDESLDLMEQIVTELKLIRKLLEEGNAERRGRY